MDIHHEDRKEPPDDPAIDKALQDIRKAKDDLVHAHEDERRAEHELDEAIDELEHAKKHEHWIVVNGRRKEVHGERVSFEEAVKLAFPNPPVGVDVQFTVQYTRGPEAKPAGTLIEGQSVKVRDGMECDVTSTNRS